MNKNISFMTILIIHNYFYRKITIKITLKISFITMSASFLKDWMCEMCCQPLYSKPGAACVREQWGEGGRGESRAFFMRECGGISTHNAEADTSRGTSTPSCRHCEFLAGLSFLFHVRSISNHTHSAFTRVHNFLFHICVYRAV